MTDSDDSTGARLDVSLVSLNLLKDTMGLSSLINLDLWRMPSEVWRLCLRGERHSANGLVLAKWLERHSHVSCILDFISAPCISCVTRNSKEAHADRRL